MQSYYQVTKTEAKAYATMKTTLGFKTDKQMLDYIKAKTINTFNPKNLLIGIDSNIK